MPKKEIRRCPLCGRKLTAKNCHSAFEYIDDIREINKIARENPRAKLEEQRGGWVLVTGIPAAYQGSRLVLSCAFNVCDKCNDLSIREKVKRFKRSAISYLGKQPWVEKEMQNPKEYRERLAKYSRPTFRECQLEIS